MISLTGGLARAKAPEIRVNVLAPGLVNSQCTRGRPHACREAAVARTLLGPEATPEDIAEVMLHIGAGAAFVNRQVLQIDGGME